MSDVTQTTKEERVAAALHDAIEGGGDPQHSLDMMTKWGREPHDGDCVGMPFSCPACIRDEWLGYARVAIAAMSTEDASV